MAQINYLHRKPHHCQFPPLPMTTYQTHNNNDHINRLKGNHIFYARKGSREVMGKIHVTKTNMKGKNYDLEMDKAQGQV